VYEDNELQFIQTSEGRLAPDGNGGYNYEYAIKGIPSTNPILPKVFSDGIFGT
jgi:hypothetical protein